LNASCHRSRRSSDAQIGQLCLSVYLHHNRDRNGAYPGGGFAVRHAARDHAFERGGILYPARMMGMCANHATAACARPAAETVDCFAVPPGYTRAERTRKF